MLQVRDYEESAAGARAREDAASMAPAQEVIRQWYPAVTRRLEQEQQEARAAGSDIAVDETAAPWRHSVFPHPSLQGRLLRMAARTCRYSLVILCCAATQIMEHGAATDRNVYGPYFCLLEPKYLAVIAINCACSVFCSRLMT